MWMYGKDLWADGNRVVVIPTNCLGANGAGLAKAAALKYPKWNAWYRAECKRGMVPGQVRPWVQEIPFKVILSCATKNDWHHRSQLPWIVSGLRCIEAALEILRSGRGHELILDRQKELKQGTKIGIPALGCGYGGLRWEEVRPLLEETAERLSNHYHVHLYSPQEIPS